MVPYRRKSPLLCSVLAAGLLSAAIPEYRVALAAAPAGLRALQEAHADQLMGTEEDCNSVYSCGDCYDKAHCRWCYGTTLLENLREPASLNFPSFIPGVCTAKEECSGVKFGTIENIFNSWKIEGADISYGVYPASSADCKKLEWLWEDRTDSSGVNAVKYTSCKECVDHSLGWCEYETTMDFTGIPEVLRSSGGVCSPCREPAAIGHSGLEAVYNYYEEGSQCPNP